MASRDTTAKLKTAVVLAQATQHTTIASSSVDTQGYDGCGFTLFAGPAGDTLSGTVYIEWDVQDSPDGTTWSAVPDNLINVQFSAANPQGIGVGTANGAQNSGCALLAQASSVLTGGITLRFGYVGANRYVRVNEVHVGTQTTGTQSQIISVLTDPGFSPTEGNLNVVNQNLS